MILLLCPECGHYPDTPNHELGCIRPEACSRPGCTGTMVKREARARMGWRDMRVRLITVCGRCGHPPVDAPGVEEGGA